MENKRIIQGLILVLIFSLTCAAIYAVETGEISESDSSNNGGHIHISRSGENIHVLDSIRPTFDINDYDTSVYV